MAIRAKMPFRFTVHFTLFLIAALSDGISAELKASCALPIFVVTTDSRPIVDRNRIPALAGIVEDLTAQTPRLDFEQAEISLRGNSTFHFQKRGYRLEFQTSGGQDKKVSLLGMPANSDWVLYASPTDRTFARNLLAHELWRAMGHYAVRWRFVELFVDTNSILQIRDTKKQRAQIDTALDAWSTNIFSEGRIGGVAREKAEVQLGESYQGLYIVLEKIKRGKERVAIARLHPTDKGEPEISGGYIIKKDDQGPGEKGLLTGQEFKVRFEEPKERELTAEQRQWVTKFLDDFETALYSRQFRDPTKGYPAYIDVDSFIDFHWLVELAKNADGYWFSQYMHKDRGGKLTMGPIWDWDRTFGNPHFPEQATNGWRFYAAADPDYTWYRRLFEDPDFLQRYIDRWAELRTNVFWTSNIFALVDRIASQASSAFQRNAQRWEAGRADVTLRAKAGVPHSAEVEDLKRWIRGRLEWIDSQEFPRPKLSVAPTGDTGMNQISMSCLFGRIFFTTNRLDPRLRGGSPSPQAFEYTQPIVLTNGIVVTARVKSDYGLWSAPVVFNGSNTVR